MSTEEENLSDVTEKPWWSEMVRELTMSGLATFFMTEDSIRKYLKEKKLPKEMISLLLESASKKKEDLFDRLAHEFGRVLNKVDIAGELGKFMETHRMHLEAKVTFEPKDNKS